MGRATFLQNDDILERYEDDLLELTALQLGAISQFPDGGIVEFAEHPSWLGLPLPLFPRQRTLLRLMFLETEHMTEYDRDVIGRWAAEFYRGPERIGVPPDVWQRVEWLKERGYPHFREVLYIGGRRGGKGHLGGVIAARKMWRMIEMGHPQMRFGIEPFKDLLALVTATNFTQARDNQYTDILNTVSRAPCFKRYRSTQKGHVLTVRTPADEGRIQLFAALGERFDREIASIVCRAISSNSRAARGVASFFQCYDEQAHMLVQSPTAMGPRSGEEVYQALTPSLDQVGLEAMIYEPTSPYTQTGISYEIYEDALTVGTDGAPQNPDMLVLQLASWDAYLDYDQPALWGGGSSYVSPPSSYDDLARRLERRDPRKFKVERRAQWSPVIDAYLDARMVDTMFEPMVLDGEARTLYPQEYGQLRWAYRAHGDPGKSQSNFAFAIGHTEPIEEEDGEVWAHVFIDRMWVWKAEDWPDGMMDYGDIKDDLASMMPKFQTLEIVTFDQYGSYATISDFKRMARAIGHRAVVREENFNEGTNRRRAERFKTALGQGWVHSYRDGFFNDEGESLLENELRFLQEKNGRLIHPTTGPVQTKDLADAVMVVTAELLADQLDRLYVRENLSNARLAVGAPGGYGTNIEAPPPSPAAASRGRAALDRFASGRYGRRPIA